LIEVFVAGSVVEECFVLEAMGKDKGQGNAK